MKKKLILLLAVLCVLSLAACGKTEAPAAGTDLWANALYTEDTELGEGAVTLTVEVTAEDRTVVFTLHTDADTVGEALTESGLIEGEEGPYGLYIKSVNGILADYDTDGTYWGFYENGDYAASSADMTAIAADTVYGLSKVKG